MIQEKIRLATLFEFVSYSGHTLVSWAGAVGTGKPEYEHMPHHVSVFDLFSPIQIIMKNRRSLALLVMYMLTYCGDYEQARSWACCWPTVGASAGVPSMRCVPCLCCVLLLIFEAKPVSISKGDFTKQALSHQRG